MGIYNFKGKYEFLDMYYPCEIKIDNIVYKNAMSAFASCRLSNIEFREDCAISDDKEYFKYLINSVRNSSINSLMVPDFDEYTSLYEILKQKFKSKEMRDKLISTGDDIIIYISKTEPVLGSYKGKGLNLLGIICMKIRDEISYC